MPEAVAPAGLGEACGADRPCEGTDYPECHVGTDEEGYCTETGCTGDDDCEGGFYCATEEGESFCKRPPTGVGEPCESDDDCAGFDADYCLTISPMGPVCVVANCTAEPNSCAPGNECQDFSDLVPGIPPLCAPPL